jgi:hypothetical protein
MGTSGMGRRGRLALGYAQRGWKIFPIKEGTKDSPRVSWGSVATSDPEIVRAWWTKWPDDNIGLACGLSNITVVDLDNKKGKAGTQEWTGLLLDNGWDGDTLTSETPSGGNHLFYEGLARTCQGFARSEGIDIRGGGGKGGYVLLPGSSYNPCKESVAKGEIAGEYAWEAGDLPLLPLPTWVTERAELRPEQEHDATPVVELDQAHFLNWGENYLKVDAEPAIEGRGGDNVTYKVACALRGRGVSEEAALQLMLEYYNSRCNPPWTHTELSEKVRHAYAYAKHGPPGWETAEAQFDDEPPEIPGAESGEAGAKSRFLLLDDLLKLSPPEWLVRGLLPMNSVGVLYGASQTFKSFFAFHLAACCSVGMPSFKDKPSKKSEAFYIAAEGAHGFKLRAEAWMKRHGVRPESLRILPASVYLDRANEAEILASEIISIADRDLPRLIVVDTLSANFTGKENTDEVAGFFRKCSVLAQKTQATVLVLHHTGKDGQKEERGHYSIRANADFSIKVERRGKEPRIVVEVQKFKDAPIGEKLHLKAAEIEVAPGAEFSSSLVLEEETPAARDFATADFEENVIEFLREFDGKTLNEAAGALKTAHGVGLTKAKNLIKNALGGSVGSKTQLAGGEVAWLERSNKNNSRSGLNIHFGKA